MRKILLLFTTVVVVGLFIGAKIEERRKVAGAATEQKTPRAIVLPHHNLATEMFHEGYQKLKELNVSPSVIVIYGTNHYHPNSPTLVTTTRLAEAKLAKEQIESLINSFPDIRVDENMVAGEHSITTQLLYIKEYFPEAKILPVIVSSQFDEEDLKKKAEYFSKLPEDTLFVASIDFAHEVSLEEGLSRNKETIKTIENFDYNTLYSYENEHLDSPVGMALTMMTVEFLDKKSWKTWQSSHGALITNNRSSQGTSYVVGVFE